MDDILKKLLGLEPNLPDPKDVPVCGCGSLQDAIDAAAKAAEQMLTHDCIHWYMAVMTIHAGFATAIMQMSPEAMVNVMRLGTMLDRKKIEAMATDILKRAGKYSE